jgi:hypothetical protein
MAKPLEVADPAADDAPPDADEAPEPAAPDALEALDEALSRSQTLSTFVSF